MHELGDKVVFLLNKADSVTESVTFPICHDTTATATNLWCSDDGTRQNNDRGSRDN